MQYIQENHAAKDVALQNLDKFMKFHPGAIFPSIYECEDILVESLNVKLRKLDRDVYNQIRTAWRDQNRHKIAHLLENLPQGVFDGGWVLGELRGHEEWLDERFQVKCMVAEMYRQRSVSILRSKMPV